MVSSFSNVSDNFLESLSSIDETYLNDFNINKVKECLIDYLAALLAGKSIVSDKLLAFLSINNFSDIDVDKIIIYNNLSLENQVYITGFTSHAAELDDGSRFGMIHPGAPLFSLLLPVARKGIIPFHQLALATMVGYEASVRLAMAIAPGHYARGYHPTATCGTIGAALGLCKLLKQNKHVFKNALSVSSVSASGSLKVIEDDSQIKPLNVANASLNALYAVRAGMSGFNGANDALGGSTGFLTMMTDQWSFDKLVRKYDDNLMIHSVYFKPFAACRHAHAPIEGALKLRNILGDKLDYIDTINVYVYDTIIGKHDNKTINGSSSAKMSIPYAVAVAITSGMAGIEAFEEPWLNNTTMRTLLDKVNVIPDENFSKLVPEKRCSRVEIVLSDNTVINETVEYAKGEPENPMELGDLFGKLQSNLNPNCKVSVEEIHQAIKMVDETPFLFYQILEKLEI